MYASGLINTPGTETGGRMGADFLFCMRCISCVRFLVFLLSSSQPDTNIPRTWGGGGSLEMAQRELIRTHTHRQRLVAPCDAPHVLQNSFYHSSLALFSFCPTPPQTRPGCYTPTTFSGSPQNASFSPPPDFDESPRPLKSPIASD